MMDALPAAAGVGFDQELSGATYHFSLITVGDLATMMDHVVSLRPSAIDALVGRLEKFTDEQQAGMIAAALAEDRKAKPKLTDEEWEGFMNSPRSGHYTLWLSLRKSYPDMTQEEVTALLVPVDVAVMIGLATRLLEASGLTSSAKKNGEAPRRKRTRHRSPTSRGKSATTS